jgi:hypothetical protein
MRCNQPYETASLDRRLCKQGASRSPRVVCGLGDESDGALSSQDQFDSTKDHSGRLLESYKNFYEDPNGLLQVWKIIKILRGSALAQTSNYLAQIIKSKRKIIKNKRTTCDRRHSAPWASAIMF